MSTYTIAIIGPKDIISGFKALGVTPFNAEDGETALSILKKMKKDVENTDSTENKFATVIIIESIVQQIPIDEMDKISKGALPAVVAIPGLEGSHGAGVEKLRRLAERAIGSDILS